MGTAANRAPVGGSLPRIAGNVVRPCPAIMTFVMPLGACPAKRCERSFVAVFLTASDQFG